jgi:predicted nucleotidyltransferase
VQHLDALRQFLLSQPLPPLFATVSGAHLYGFESPDSDVDLRGIFVLPLPEVLGLKQPVETHTVVTEIDGLEVDFVGHDVHKFVTLMTRRNGYVLEQLYSPLVVVGGARFEELRVLGRGCRTRHVYHHYRGFLHNQLALLKKGGTVKELLYAYRVALTGIYYLKCGETEAHLPTLLETSPLPGVSELIVRKREGTEKQGLAPGELELHQGLLDALAGQLDQAFETSPLPEDVANWDDLNDFVVRARIG